MRILCDVTLEKETETTMKFLLKSDGAVFPKNGLMITLEKGTPTCDLAYHCITNERPLALEFNAA